MLLERWERVLPVANEYVGDSLREVLPSDGNVEFANLQTTALRAMARILKCDVSEVDSELVSAKVGINVTYLRLKRTQKYIHAKALREEITNYFHALDVALVYVEILGDFFDVAIRTRHKGAHLLGNVLRSKLMREFILDDLVKMPVIAGVTAGGFVIDDFWRHGSYALYGPARSGRSWELIKDIVNLCLFQTPNDLQIFVIDVLGRQLTYALNELPHVTYVTAQDSSDLNNPSGVGLAGVAKLRELRDEAVRRLKLLENVGVKCVDGLRLRGYELPSILLAIDNIIEFKHFVKWEDNKQRENLLREVINILTYLRMNGSNTDIKLYVTDSHKPISESISNQSDYHRRMQELVVDGDRVLGVMSNVSVRSGSISGKMNNVTLATSDAETAEVISKVAEVWNEILMKTE
jgi:hypothetical protein